MSERTDPPRPAPPDAPAHPKPAPDEGGGIGFKFNQVGRDDPAPEVLVPQVDPGVRRRAVVAALLALAAILLLIVVSARRFGVESGGGGGGGGGDRPGSFGPRDRPIDPSGP